MDPVRPITLYGASENVASPLSVFWLGRRRYEEALLLQKELGSLRSLGKIPDTVLLLEHPHTYTVGAHGSPNSFPINRAEFEAEGVAFHLVDRGGDVTYHGPGQLVGYPIMDMKPRGIDLMKYVRDLEEVIIIALKRFGISGERSPGYPGVWVGQEKIAAIGIKVNKNGITSHGFALNIACDLKYFSFIVPCGIKDRGVTSVEKILEAPPGFDEVRDALIIAFGDVFQTSPNLSIAANSSPGFMGFDT